MDIEKKREREQIINDIHQLQLERKIVSQANKITFSNYFNYDAKGCTLEHKIYLSDNIGGQNYRDSIVHELDMKIELLIDKLKNI